MRRFRLEHRISHADVDLVGELKTSALLGLLEQTAVEASTDVGLDPAWYSDTGRVWLIRRTRLERFLPVGGGDAIAIDTEVADWRRARSLRRYEVRLAVPGRGIRSTDALRRAHAPDASAAEQPDGALVARATTDWVYCDLATGRPVTISDDVRRAFSGDAIAPTLPRARALPDAFDGEPIATRLRARPSHLDHVTHVNNAAYAGFLEDGAFDLFAARGLSLAGMLELGGALRWRSLDLEYLIDALAGDDLVVRSWATAAPLLEVPIAAPTAETELLQTIERADGTLLVRSASAWLWRSRPAILGGAPDPPALDAEERACLRTWVERLVATLGDELDSVWLFGSAARGERWPAGMSIRSDIDVLVATRSAADAGVVQSLGDATFELLLRSGRQISPQFRTSTALATPPDDASATFRASFERDARLLWRRVAQT